MILDSNVFLTLPEETGIGAQTLTIFDESSLYYDFASKGTRCLHAIQDATAETLTYCQIRSMAAETKARRVPPVHEATGGYAVRRPPPIRLYSASSFFSLFLVWAIMLLIFCFVTIWVSVLNPALPCRLFVRSVRVYVGM